MNTVRLELPRLLDGVVDLGHRPIDTPQRGERAAPAPPDLVHLCGTELRGP